MESRASQKRKTAPEDDNEPFATRHRTSKLLKLSSSATAYSFHSEAPEPAIGSADASSIPQTRGAIDAALEAQHPSWTTRGHQLSQVNISGHAQVNVGDHLAFEGSVTQHIHGHVYHQAPGQERTLGELKAALDLQQTVLNQQSAKLNQFVANIAFTELDKVEGKNIEAILVPLVNIAPDFAKALTTLAKEGAMVLAPAEMEWLIDEFENLIDFGHNTRKSLRKSAMGRRGLVRSARASQDRYQNQQQANPAGRSALVTERRGHSALSRTCTLETPSGNLQIMLQRSGHEGPDHHLRSCAVQLRYYPRYDLPDPTGLTAMFFKRADAQCVYRQIRVFNNIGFKSDLELLIADDNVQALRDRLVKGTASIYDCDHVGNSLVSLAIGYGSQMVLAELVNSGAPLRMYYLSYLVERAMSLSEAARRLHQLSCALERDEIFEDSNSGYLRDITQLLFHLRSNILSHHNAEDEVYHRISAICCNIIDQVLLLGADLERINEEGYTPLLYLCGYGYDDGNAELCERVVRKFIEAKADVSAVSGNGQNALHLLLRRFFGECMSPHLSVLQSLLRAGCDPNALSDDGYTPSDYITQEDSSVIAIWDETLRSCGYRRRTIKSASGANFDIVENGTSLLPITGWTLQEWLDRRLDLSTHERTSFPLHDIWQDGHGFHLERSCLPIGPSGEPYASDLSTWLEWKHLSTSDVGMGWNVEEFFEWKYLDTPCTIEEALEWKSLPVDTLTTRCCIHMWSQWKSFSKSDAGTGWTLHEWLEKTQHPGSPNSVSSESDEHEDSFLEETSDKDDDHDDASSQDEVRGDDENDLVRDPMDWHEKADEEISRLEQPGECDNWMWTNADLQASNTMDWQNRMGERLPLFELPEEVDSRMWTGSDPQAFGLVNWENRTGEEIPQYAPLEEVNAWMLPDSNRHTSGLMDWQQGAHQELPQYALPQENNNWVWTEPNQYAFPLPEQADIGIPRYEQSQENNDWVWTEPGPYVYPLLEEADNEIPPFRWLGTVDS